MRGHRSLRRRRPSSTLGGPDIETKPGSNPCRRDRSGQERDEAAEHPLARRSGHCPQLQEHSDDSVSQTQEGKQKSFNHYLARALVRIAREWVKVDASVLAELKRLASKLKAPKRELTPKNKAFLRQFDDPRALLRLAKLPEQLWREVKNKKDEKPNFRTLAKAQAALGIGILTYLPVRPENLWALEFDTHLFVRG